MRVVKSDGRQYKAAMRQRLRESRMSNALPKAVIKLSLVGVATVAFLGGALSSAGAQQTSPVSIRNLTPHGNGAWVPDRPTGDDFLPPPSGAGPIMSPKDRPYVPNGTGRQPTYRIADTSNPILKPWAKEQMEKANDAVRAGKVPYITRERCWPAGVPGFTVYTRVQAIHFYPSKSEITIVNELNTQIRHIHMDVPHSANPGHSWYGESVGHYEG